jgi:hypothetical protein
MWTDARGKKAGMTATNVVLVDDCVYVHYPKNTVVAAKWTSVAQQDDQDLARIFQELTRDNDNRSCLFCACCVQ